MRKVVSNTGPLLHLQEAQLLSLLEQVGQLYIPKAVDLEMVQYDQDWRDHKPGWIVAATASAPHSSSLPIKPLIPLTPWLPILRRRLQNLLRFRRRENIVPVPQLGNGLHIGP